MVRSALLTLLVVVVAVIGGGTSVWYMIDTQTGVGEVRIGSWVAVPDIDTLRSDPYARAHIARAGLLVLGRAEGLIFLAPRDTDGLLLSSACRYLISGPLPAARVWTLHATGTSIDRHGNTALTAGINSRGALYQPDGSIVVEAGPHPAPGNWLATNGDGAMTLVLTLYDTPVTGDLELGATDLPAVERIGCDA